MGSGGLSKMSIGSGYREILNGVAFRYEQAKWCMTFSNEIFRVGDW